ncbi:MAG: single-stranded DNA-binding protein [Clostridia bacterium]
MNYELLNNNVVTISGVVVSTPEYSHHMYGEGFYESKIAVSRLSEQIDEIPFTISERLLDSSGLEMGKSITLTGQMRSYNKIIDGKSKLLLTLFVRDVLEEPISKNPNIIDIAGYVCKPPIYRTTPFKREICDILLAVNRAYNKSDYLPCIAWGRNARFIKDMDVGAKIKINGRIQSREYQKLLEDGEVLSKIAYEISINRIELDETED